MQVFQNYLFLVTFYNEIINSVPISLAVANFAMNKISSACFGFAGCKIVFLSQIEKYCDCDVRTFQTSAYPDHMTDVKLNAWKPVIIQVRYVVLTHTPPRIYC